MVPRSFEIARRGVQMHPATIYYWVRGLRIMGLGFHAVVYAPYLESIGVPRTQMLLINMLFWLSIFAMELPTGMLADGKSRAWSVKTGTGLMALSMFVYSFAQGFMSALIAEVMIGMALAFISGAEQAWITDALGNRGEKENLSKTLATGAIVESLFLLVGGTGGAFLGAHNMRLPWMIGAGIAGVAFVFAVLFMDAQGEPIKRMTEKEAFMASLKTLGRSKNLMWIVVAVWIFGLIMPFNFWWTLFYKNRVGDGTYGLTWIPIYLGLVLAGWFIRRRGISKGDENLYVFAALLVTGGGLAMIGRFSGYAMPLAMTVIHEIGRGIFRPSVEVYTQRRIESAYRATYGSLHSFLASVGTASLLGIMYLILRNHAPDEALITTTWTVVGSLMVFVTLVWWLLRPKN